MRETSRDIMSSNSHGQEHIYVLSLVQETHNVREEEVSDELNSVGRRHRSILLADSLVGKVLRNNNDNTYPQWNQQRQHERFSRWHTSWMRQKLASIFWSRFSSQGFWFPLFVFAFHVITSCWQRDTTKLTTPANKVPATLRTSVMIQSRTSSHLKLWM